MSHIKLAAVAIAIALVSSTPRILDAQASTVTISAGDEREICSGTNAVQPDAAKNGTWTTKPDEKDKTLVHVLYKANTVNAAVNETVTCGPDKKAFTINVTPTQAFSNDAYGVAFKALFLLFVLATVLESALAILFNWRPFVETFNARAVKPVFSFLVALAFVFGGHMDIVSKLAKLISPETPPFEGVGSVLTAMVIAGGSAAVNNLMVALGFRQVRTPETIAPKPPANKGWISVSIVRTRPAAIKGPVDVCIGVPDGAGAVPAVARLEKSTRPGWRYFLRDPGRFPGSGGYAVTSGATVKVECSAVLNPGPGRKTETWGPKVIADGAIIDLTFEM